MTEAKPSFCVGRPCSRSCLLLLKLLMRAPAPCRPPSCSWRCEARVAHVLLSSMNTTAWACVGLASAIQWLRECRTAVE